MSQRIGCLMNYAFTEFTEFGHSANSNCAKRIGDYVLRKA